jgi:ATP-binding cassette subfamily F protein 3
MISLASVCKRFGPSVLFENATAAFNEDHRIGLVGPNGSGKTTLLRMIAGDEMPDSGSVDRPRELTTGYLPQEIEVLGERPPLDIVLEPYAHLVNYDVSVMSLAKALETDKADHRETLHSLHVLQSQAEYHGAFSLPSRAKSILAGLGVPEESWERPVRILSGGFRMRVVLAKLLLMSPRMLLLDEPTNHLDMDSLIWLEKFLGRAKCGMIIVSHDRGFLNRTTSQTAEIHNRLIILYKGNYDSFVRQRSLQEQAARSTAENLEREIRQNERFIERFRAKNTKASAVQSRVKKVERLKAEIPALRGAARSIRFRFPSPPPCGSVPIKAENISAGYGGAPVFENLSLTVTRGEKIALIGPNGAGKSTLLKVLAGIIAPSSGVITAGHNAEIRYFSQHQLEQLDPSLSVYDTIVRFSGNSEKTFVSGLLGAFLFGGGDTDKKVGVLSGGEKSRCALAMILSRPGNVLLLDEPTNHLDMQAVEVLAEALGGFKGTILMVSHNEYFIERIAGRILEMRPGVFRDFPGSLEDYRRYVELLFGGRDTPCEDRDDTGAQDIKTEKQERMRRRDRLKDLTRRIGRLERQISEKEESVARCDALLHDPSNASDYPLLQRHLEEKQRLQKETETLMDEWEGLQKELEVTEKAGN